MADSFTPFNQSALGTADLDLASAGMTLLPDAVGTVAHPHLMVTSGKDGEMYVLDRDNMGQYQSSYTTPNSQIVQWLPYGATSGIPALGVQPVTVTNATLPYRSNSYQLARLLEQPGLLLRTGGLLQALLREWRPAEPAPDLQDRGHVPLCRGAADHFGGQQHRQHCHPLGGAVHP